MTAAADQRKAAFASLVDRATQAAWEHDSGARHHLTAQVLTVHHALEDLLDAQRACCPCDAECRCHDCESTRQERADEANEASRERALDAADLNERGAR